MTPAALAIAAHFECAERQRLYPARVAGRKISAQDAEDDTECWHLIARAFETGATLESVVNGHRGPRPGCYELRAALDRAIDSRTKACTRFPDDAKLAARRDAVTAIDTLLRPRIQFWCDLNDELRRRVIDRQPATAKAA